MTEHQELLENLKKRHKELEDRADQICTMFEMADACTVSLFQDPTDVLLDAEKSKCEKLREHESKLRKSASVEEVSGQLILKRFNQALHKISTVSANRQMPSPKGVSSARNISLCKLMQIKLPKVYPPGIITLRTPPSLRILCGRADEADGLKYISSLMDDTEWVYRSFSMSRPASSFLEVGVDIPLHVPRATLSSNLCVCVHPLTKTIYLGDRSLSQIFVFDEEFEYQTRFGANGGEDGQFQSMSCCVISPDGQYIAVVDRSTNKIVLYDENHDFLRNIYGESKSGEKFGNIWFCTFDSENNLYVTEFRQDKVRKFDVLGNELWGLDENSQIPNFDGVGGIAINGRNELVFVCCFSNFMTALNTDGEFLWSKPTVNLKSAGMIYLTSGPEGGVVVVVPSHNKIYFYSVDGELLHSIDCKSPITVAFDCHERLLITSASRGFCMAK